MVRRRMVSRGKAKRADYILTSSRTFRSPLSKRRTITAAWGDGMQQALEYAETLKIPFVFSSNGDGFVFHDRTGTGVAIETNLSLDEFPSPATLWCATANARDCRQKSTTSYCRTITPMAAGKGHATTRRPPSTRRPRRLLRGSSASCWRWQLALARPIRPFRSSGACKRPVARSELSSWPIETSSLTRRW